MAILRTSSAVVVREVGVEEILLTAAIALAMVAIWPWCGRLSLLVPAVVLLWIALPARAPFLARPPDKADRRTN